MHHPTDRIAHTMTFVTPVVEHWLDGEIAQWVLPLKDQSDYPSHHERTLLPQSYISLLPTGWSLVEVEILDQPSNICLWCRTTIINHNFFVCWSEMELCGRSSFHGLMGHQINSLWWTHWVISCSMTSVIKAVVFIILSVIEGGKGRVRAGYLLW